MRDGVWAVDGVQNEINETGRSRSPKFHSSIPFRVRIVADTVPFPSPSRNSIFLSARHSRHKDLSVRKGAHCIVCHQILLRLVCIISSELGVTVTVSTVASYGHHRYRRGNSFACIFFEHSSKQDLIISRAVV